MTSAIRMVGHEERLSVVGHLEELRGRLLISLLALAVAFGVCFWQSHALLRIINRPLDKQTQGQVKKGNGPLGQTALAQQAVLRVAGDTSALARELSAPASGLPPAVRARIAAEIPRLQADVAKVPRVPQGNKPVTLGIGEPFTTTVTVSFYFALVLALPVILFELYGFVLPALLPKERRAAVPLLWAVPLLFAVGVLFGYFVVLPAAVRFLQNFNSGEFNVLVQASPYYDFVATLLLAMGLCFELPVLILGLTRAGVVNARMLRKGRRYAVVGCVLVAAILPGDAITMALEALPLYILYEVSIVLAALVERRARRASAAEAAEASTAALP
jgi:sec-independent protein translocase protein TatC